MCGFPGIALPTVEKWFQEIDLWFRVFYRQYLTDYKALRPQHIEKIYNVTEVLVLQLGWQ